MKMKNNVSKDDYFFTKHNRGARAKKLQSLKDERYELEKDLVAVFQLSRHKEIIDWTD